MDQTKRDRIAALLAEGMPQAEIVRITNIPQATVSRYAASIAAAAVPDDKRSRLLETFQVAKRKGDASTMRRVSLTLDKIDDAQNPKPEIGMQPDFVAAVSSALGFWPQSEAPLTDAEENAKLADALRKGAMRFADNKRFLVCAAGMLSILEECDLPDELESEVQEYEEEANESESDVPNDSDADKTETRE